MADLKPGDLVGWKMRAALILGHVDRVEGDKVVLIPESKPSKYTEGPGRGAKLCPSRSLH